ncbi:uncharacterized protein DSM5745_09906 [Aspergillus mulundensis]|uniref:BTB domain-containing protein n=1 Tax=Aspergillus mulundensis TaxID=1810919 RepID=A0A3D8QRS4_9EURO|nr:hypothetical protein DSM5745_09906 [Aspergillus mulundensis]RDW64495.1 hypothetical protein DSM5745_09906 [Aspergillus mulundensis]
MAFTTVMIFTGPTWNDWVDPNGDTTIIVPVNFAATTITDNNVPGQGFIQGELPEDPAQPVIALFRVSSDRLSVACPDTFGRILNSPQMHNQRFANRHAHYTTSPYDPIAFGIFLRMLYRNPGRPALNIMKFDQVMKLAQLAVHYGGPGGAQVKDDVSTWIRAREVPMPIENVKVSVKAIWTAILLNMEDQFGPSTFNAISWATEEITAFGTPVPNPVIVDLNSHRDIAITEVLEKWHAALRDFKNKDWVCTPDCKDRVRESLLQHMGCHPLLFRTTKRPYRGFSYQELVNLMLSFQCPKDSTINHTKEHPQQFSFAEAWETTHRCPRALCWKDYVFDTHAQEAEQHSSQEPQQQN